MEYATRHPERVSKLLLIGGYAHGWKWSESENFVASIEAMVKLIELGWGNPRSIAFRQLFTSMFMPNAPRENQDWFNELQRKTTSARNAARLMQAIGDIDIRDRLHLVSAPTLVMHARHDMTVPYNAGRELAGGIPGARFITLHTSNQQPATSNQQPAISNHMLPATDPAWQQLCAEMEAFLSS